MPVLRQILVSFLLCCAAWSLPARAVSPGVLSFSPSGAAKAVRQVQVRFNTQMVAFGDLSLADPFTIDCPEAGSGRWIDGANWSYDFARDLPGGVACRFTLKPGLKNLAGQPLPDTTPYSFNTGGPAIVQAMPREGNVFIDEQQVFVLGLDALPREDTVAEHAWCRADGINERIPVRVLAGAERDQILAQRKDFTERYLSLYFRARGVVWRATTGVRSKRLEQMPIVVLQCKRRLPAEAGVALVWGAGIAADSGIANTQDQTLRDRKSVV